MVWSIKQFDDSEWDDEVKRAGLKIDTVEEGLIQRWYFLRLATL
jgi:hypothetical protein